MRYHCFNLTVDSYLPLPELPLDPDQPDNKVDVWIKQGEVMEHGLPHGWQMGPFLWMATREVWIHVPEIARYWVKDGGYIHVAPYPQADEESIRVYLFGVAMGALLIQRGLLVLHGNAVQVGDGCMICVGPSGSGKSTLAAGMLQRGYPVLADDMVAIDNNYCALPGLPYLRLWHDVANKLDIPLSGLKPVRPNLKKYHYPIHSKNHKSTVPVKWIYILSPHNRSDILLSPLSGKDRFIPLRDNSYRPRFVRGLGMVAENMFGLSQLSNKAHVAKVERPKTIFNLNGLVATLLQDMEQNFQ